MILYKKTSSNLFLSSPLNVLRDLGSSVKPTASAHQTDLIRAAHLAGAEALDRVQSKFKGDSVTKTRKEKLFKLADISLDYIHLNRFH